MTGPPADLQCVTKKVKHLDIIRPTKDILWCVDNQRSKLAALLACRFEVP